jgi:broad specificity phosphatase PhoE
MQPFPGRGRIFLLRHGETDWNRERRIMGRRPVPLSERGRAQLLVLAPHLERLGVEKIFTSPLPRARASAELIAAHLGAVPIVDEPGLTEVDYGAWEGRTFRELVHEPEFRTYWQEPVETPAPGGGESLLQVRDRVFAGMGRVTAAAGERPVIVVSHGDPLRMIVCGCLQIDIAQLRRIRLDNGALSAIELTGDWAEVKFLNMRPDLEAMLDG